MTPGLRDELASLPATRQCCRQAEVSTLLRLAGAVQTIGGRTVIEATFDSSAQASRLRSHIVDLYSHDPVVTAGTRHTLRQVTDAEALARLSLMVDQGGLVTRGLPRELLTAKCDLVSIWRAAIMARGSITETDKSISLEVSCPDRETADLLANIGTKMHVDPAVREERGRYRVVVRNPRAIEHLLSILGAERSREAWGSRREHRAARTAASRSTNLAMANAQRAAKAAADAVLLVEQALSTLGDRAPADLRSTGELRLAYPTASLASLGQMHHPALTKSAVAARLRRLTASALDRPGAA